MDETAPGRRRRMPLALAAMALAGCQDREAAELQALELMVGEFELRDSDFDRIEKGFLPVLVQEFQTGDPLEGAELWFTPLSDHRYFLDPRDHEPSGHSPDDAGEGWLTDERGIGWIRPAEQIGMLMASWQGGGGSKLLMPNDADAAAARCGLVHTLMQIETGSPLHIDRPSDATGEPLPVYLRNAESGIRRLIRPSHDSSGELLYQGDLFDLQWISDDGLSTNIRVIPGFCEEAGVPFTLSMQRSGRADLPAPPTGQLDLTILTRDGKAAPARTAVTLEPAGGPCVNRLHPLGDPDLAGVAVNGRLLLRGLPLGKRWRLGFRTEGVLGRLDFEADGPTSAGETVPLTLDPRPLCRPLRASLLASTGAPLAERQVWVQLDGKAEDEAMFAFARHRTSAAGELLAHYALPVSGSWERITFRLNGNPNEPPAAATDLPLPASGDFGAVALRMDEDLRVWGAVEDARGEAVRSAKVRGPDGVARPVAADGSFSMDEEAGPSAAAFPLIAGGPWHLPRSVPALGPDAGTRIALQQGGRVHGRLLLPDAARPYRVHVELLGAPALPPELEEMRAEFDAFSRLGSFDCGPFPPGTWDLRLRIGGLTVAELPAVHLEPGALLRDPRLAALDLSDRIAFQLAVLTERGRAPNEPVEVSVERADGTLLATETGSLLLPPDAVRVRVAVQGYRTVTVPARAGPAKIVLEPE